MDLEADGRFGNKRVHNRLGPAPGAASSSSSGKVCIHWRAGRCNRFPCPYLHSELPEANANSKRPNQRDGPGGNVWRNPNSGGGGGGRGGGGGGFNRWGRGPGGADGGGKQKVADRPCKYFLGGEHCSYGERCRYPHTYCMSNSITLLTPLQGHENVVTGIALPTGSDKLYSGSKDGTVRFWDCQTGQCAGVLKVGGEVGCMISEGPWLFVGIPDAVKVWNMQTQAEMNLTGPTGQVYALAVGNELLFAATQDGRILAWRFSAATNCFEPAASLVGHQLAVVSLTVGGMRLYSGSMDKTIRVRTKEDLCTIVHTFLDTVDVGAFDASDREDLLACNTCLDLCQLPLNIMLVLSSVFLMVERGSLQCTSSVDPCIVHSGTLMTFLIHLSGRCC